MIAFKKERKQGMIIFTKLKIFGLNFVKFFMCLVSQNFAPFYYCFTVICN